jgi:hypothetical protein
LSAVPEPLAASAGSYLSRLWQLNETARAQLGQQLAADLAARVSPPPPAGLLPADYLYTVLAERRNRNLARLLPPPVDSPAPGSVPWPAPPPAASTYPAPPQNTTSYPAPAQNTTSYPAPPQDTTFTPPA